MYPLLLTFGLAAAILWLALVEPQSAADPATIEKEIGGRLDAAVVATLTALASSRLSFVMLHWQQYQSAPLEALAVWQGGLTAWGAAFGLLFGLWIYAVRSKNNFWTLADAFAGPASLVALSAWLGCLIVGCAYGRTPASAMLALASPDLLGQRQPRWPTQSLGALASISLLGLASLGFQSSRLPGIKGISVWLGHSLILLGLSWLRADPIRYFGELRSDTLGAAAMSLTGILLLIYRWRAGDSRTS